VEVKPVERSIISLEKMETAVEKLSDGTLSIAQTTTLAVPSDNLGIISPLTMGSDFGDGSQGRADELENKITDGEDSSNRNEANESENKTMNGEDYSTTINILDH
jgi:hypothetical protein